jgi:hypothetical protein
LSLADEPLAGERLGDLIAQHFDRDVAVVPQVAREVDRGHAAAAKFTLNVYLLASAAWSWL